MSGVDTVARRPDAFLSYSRRDGALADRLVALLERRGKDVWIDRHDIPAASRWRDELARAIEVSDAVVALVTPSWAASENCRQELEHAEAAGKRIVPVLGAPTGSVPEALSSRQWVELAAGEEAAVDAIVAAIETDLPYVRAHARYLEEEQRWTASGGDRGYLVRGGELRAAEEWLATRSERREPRPTAGQIAFVQASRADATRRLRILTAAAVVAAAAVVVLGIVALVQRNSAVEREQTARSRELAALSAARRSSDPEEAVKLAAEGLRVRDTGEAQIALRAAIAASPVIARFGGPGDPVDDAAITRDGTTVVAAGRDGRVRAVDVATGEVRWSWSGTAGLQVVAIAPGEREVAVGQPGGIAQILAMADGTPVARFQVPQGGEITVAVPGPDGRALAATAVRLGTFGGTARLWARDGGRPVTDLSAGDEFPQRPVFSAAGNAVVVPYVSGATRVWDARTGRLRHVLRGHSDRVNRVDVDPADRWIATGSDDGTVRLWSADTGRPRGVLLRGDEAVRFVRFSADGARLAATGADGTAWVWQVPAGRLIAEFTGHEGSSERAQFLDDRTLVTGSLDATARVWDIPRERQSGILLGHGLGVNVQPEARLAHFLTVGAEGTARVWRLPAAATRVIGAPGSVDRIALARDGRRLATERSIEAALLDLAPDGRARRLRTSDRSVGAGLADDGSAFALAGDGLQFFDGDGNPGGARAVDEQAYSAVAVSADGDRAAGRRVGGGVDLWSTTDKQLVAALPTPAEAPFGELAFSRDGTRLAFAGIGGPLVIVDSRTGAVLRSVPPPERTSLPAFAIDPAGRRVFRVNYGFPQPPTIIDVATGSATVLTGTTPGALDVAAFSSDGSELLTAGGGAAQIWDAGTGSLLAEIGRDRARTSTAAFSPDDRLVVTGHDDGLVRVWDRRSEALLGEYDGGAGEVEQVATAFEGTRILAVGADSTLRMFTCDACGPADELLDVAPSHVAFGDLGESG